MMSVMSEQPFVPPHSVAAEESVLGAVLLDPSLFPEVAAILKSTDFFLVKYGMIFTAMETLAIKELAIELIALTEELKARKWLDDIGGIAELVRLSAFLPTSMHALTHANIIKRAAIRRKIAKAADELQRLAVDETNDLLTIEPKIRQTIDRAFEEKVVPQATWESVVADAMLDWRDKQPKVIATGLIDLDRAVAMTAGMYIVIAARQKTGKTRFLAQLCLKAAKEGKRVLFCTVEMPVQELIWMLAEMESTKGMTVQGLKSGLLQTPPYAEALKEFDTFGEWLAKSPLEIVNVTGKTVEQVRLLVTGYPAGYYDLVVVDYSQRFTPTPGNWDTALMEKSHRPELLAQLALTYECVIVDASQLNRESAGKGQGPQNLSTTDHYASVPGLILIFERDPDGPDPQNVTVRITSRFSASCAPVALYFHPTRGIYQNAAKEQVDLSKV